MLRAVNARLVDAALTALERLAFGRQVGKLLGERHVTGDLTGLSRLRFDLPGQHPLRFRIVYRLIEDDTMIEVLAIGERGDVGSTWSADEAHRVCFQPAAHPRPGRGLPLGQEGSGRP